MVSLGRYKYHSVKAEWTSWGLIKFLAKAHMRLNAHEKWKKRQKIALQGIRFSYVSRSLSTPLSCSCSVKTANFLIKALCRVIKYQMWLRCCWENDVCECMPTHSPSMSMCLCTYALISSAAALIGTMIWKRSISNCNFSCVVKTGQGHGWEQQHSNYLLCLCVYKSWGWLKSLSHLNVSNDSVDKHKVKWSQ